MKQSFADVSAEERHTADSKGAEGEGQLKRALLPSEAAAAIKSVSLIMEWFTMCSMVLARASSALSSPALSVTIAVPVRMNPICDMDEHASVRFRFTENRARTAPSAMVISPSARTVSPKYTFPIKTDVEVMRIP